MVSRLGLLGRCCIVLALMTATACTGDASTAPNPRTSIDLEGATGTDPAAPSSPQPRSSDTGLDSLSSLPGRLAISLGTDGLVTARPDGSQLVPVAQAEGAAEIIAQPTFSPDGTHLAWVQVDPENQHSNVVVAAPDGSDAVATPTDPLVAFFLSWDPTSSRLGVLGNGPESIELDILELDAGLTSLAHGQPFYLAWAPDGMRLLAHVQGSDLTEFDLQGKATKLTHRAGSFQAPWWSDDGETQIYALATGGQGQSLTVRRGAHEEAILDYLGDARFVATPDGSSVAILTPPAGQGADAGGLFVVDTTTGETQTVTREIIVAFSWSPDGQSLAYLAPVRTPEGVFGQWRVWKGGTTSGRYALHTPSEEYASTYLPFFDQYAQGMSMWSPDSSAFAYAGIEPGGDASGVWVQRLEGAAKPVRIGDGDVVTWGSGT